jgi:hypothetical protein
MFLRRRALTLYPLLNASKADQVFTAIKRLDRALINCRGLTDENKMKELVRACDFAEMVLP